MKFIAYFPILVVFILGQAGCSWIESPSSREARTNLLAQIEITQKAIQKKQNILKPVFYDGFLASEFDCSKKSVNELENIRVLLQEHEITLNSFILSYKSRISEAERKEACQHNTRIEFSVSPDLSVENIVAIVQIIEDSQVLHPRILSIQITGTNTVEVMTGKTRGPLDGMGDSVYMEQKNGEWIINNVGGWAR